MARIRFSYARRDPLKYISHLDMMRLFQRALRRSGLPLAYSEGFNPHQRFNLAVPLPVNVTAAEEYGEVFFTEQLSPDRFMFTLRPQLPAGLDITGAFAAPENAPALPSLVDAALYRAAPAAAEACEFDSRSYREALRHLMEREEILVARPRKKHKITYIDVRPYIIDVTITEAGREQLLEISLLLGAGSRGGVSPFFVIEELEKELGGADRLKSYWELHREKLFTGHGRSLRPLSEEM